MVYKCNKMEPKMFLGMDIWEFLFVTGFAIAVLGIGWGDRDLRRESRQLRRSLRYFARDLSSKK